MIWAVSHMLSVGQALLLTDAPQTIHRWGFLVTNTKLKSIAWFFLSSCCNSCCIVLPLRFGFHQPPFNSVDHLHLHCFALPFVPRYRYASYSLIFSWEILCVPLTFPWVETAISLFYNFLSNIDIKTDGKPSSTSLWDLLAVLLKQRRCWIR